MVILAFMPGLIFFRSYFQFPYPRALSATDEIVGAMIFAVPFQAVGILMVHLFTSYRVDLIQFGTLMDGAKSDIANEVAFDDLTRFLWPIVGYNLALWVFANCCGNLARWAVIRSEYDIDYSWLRFSAEWYYLLSGREWRWKAGEDFDLIFADVMVAGSPAPLIYSGILKSVHFSRDGAVESLVFARPEKWAVPGSYLAQKIPGQAFVLRFDQVLNLNFRLFKFDDLSSAPPPNRPVLAPPP